MPQLTKINIHEPENCNLRKLVAYEYLSFNSIGWKEESDDQYAINLLDPTSINFNRWRVWSPSGLLMTSFYVLSQ